MASFNYVIDDSTIIKLLGVQSFTTKESAVLELVKNAYDACAKNLVIRITLDSIELTDDGIGMSVELFEKNWIHVGKSEKGYKVYDAEGKNRILAGSKGIGRFALARLGNIVKMTSTQEKSKTLIWSTDWKTNDYYVEDEAATKGTKFFITDLRDKWNEKSVYLLSSFIGRAYMDESLNISLFFNDSFIPLEKPFDNAKIGENYVTEINLAYNSINQSLQCNITSDEFLDEAKNYYSKNSIANYFSELNVLDEVEKNPLFEDYNVKELLKKLGSFSCKFFFNENIIFKDAKKLYLYKHDTLPGIKTGVVLYRNAFSISSFDGAKDWLGLSVRARKSPAAATHKTGSWRVKNNQLSGFVLIDKEDNSELVDLANRQGVDENIYFELLKQIVYLGISEFEGYRQDIIREINKKNEIEIKDNNSPLLEKIIQEEKRILDLDEIEKHQLIVEIKDQTLAFKNITREMKEKDENMKHDIRILHLLSTAGLRALSVAHELHNDKNQLLNCTDKIENALKEYDLWDIVSSKENTAYAFKNIPLLLKNQNKANSTIARFIKSILSNTEKENLEVSNINISDFFMEYKKRWERDYSWVKFTEIPDKEIFLSCSRDILFSIFDNLVINSIQQNEDRNALNIQINAIKDKNFLTVNYKDDGHGLANKYKDNPMRILNSFETTRKNGHGLGMWILNNTLSISGGQVNSIDSKNGFSISFSIGEINCNEN